MSICLRMKPYAIRHVRSVPAEKSLVCVVKTQYHRYNVSASRKSASAIRRIFPQVISFRSDHSTAPQSAQSSPAGMLYASQPYRWSAATSMVVNGISYPHGWRDPFASYDHCSKLLFADSLAFHSIGSREYRITQTIPSRILLFQHAEPSVICRDKGIVYLN